MLMEFLEKAYKRQTSVTTKIDKIRHRSVETSQIYPKNFSHCSNFILVGSSVANRFFFLRSFFLKMKMTIRKCFAKYSNLAETAGTGVNNSFQNFGWNAQMP